MNHRPVWTAVFCAVALLMASCSTGEETAHPAPTGTETPAPQPANDASQAGALPIGAAAYDVPDDALVVDPVHGDDDADGTAQSPFRTVQRAADTTAPGGTIVLRAGEYHETVYVNTPVTIQNDPGAEVWLDGSEDVTQWTRAGNLWWAPLPTVLDRRIGPDAGDPYVSEDFPAAAEPEMLFRDGRQLRQVLDRSEVDQDSFYADRRHQRLYVGDGPHGPGGNQEWRTASLAQAIVVSSPDVTIRGIGVRRYGNSVQTQGAVYLARQGNLLENVVVEDVATTGVTFYSDANRGTGAAHRTTVRRAGLMGIGGSMADGLRIRGVLIDGANAERFNATPNSGGIKITKSRDVAVEGTVVRKSLGTTGIWLDESVVGFGLYHNRVIDNGVAGITIELSSHGAIGGNTVSGHDLGVVIYSSGDIGIQGNKIYNNSQFDLDLRQDHRRQADRSANGHDPRFPPGDATNTWLVSNVRVDCNVLGPGAVEARLRAVDLNTGIPADNMAIQVNHNVFATGATAARWGTGPPGQTREITDPRLLPGRDGAANRAGPTPTSPPCAAFDGPSRQPVDD